MAEHSLVEVASLSTDFTVLDCAWMPSSPKLLTVGSTLAGQGVLAVHSLSGAGLQEVARGGGGKALRCATFSSGTARLLATGDFQGRLDIWNPESLQAPVEGVVAHDELVNSIAEAGEGHRLVTGARDGRMRVWDSRKLARSVASMEGEPDGRSHDCWAVTCSKSGDVVVGGFSNGDVRMWDLRNTKVHIHIHTGVLISKNENTFVTVKTGEKV